MKKPRKKTEHIKSALFAKWRHALAVAAVIAFIAIAYGISLGNSFQFDDNPRILQNDQVSSFLLRGYPFFHGQRSVVNFTLWLNYRWGGYHSQSYLRNENSSFYPDPSRGFSVWRYHVFNILFHCTNSVLVYFLVLKILELIRWTGNDFKRWAIALGTALLFGLHPVQTQAVTYIIQRAELLAAFFQLAALLCYIAARTRQQTWKRIVFLFVMLLSYSFGLESKEQAAILPVLIVLFEFLIMKNERKNRLPVAAATMAILLLLTAVFLHNLAITYKGDTAAGFDIKGISKGHYALTNIRVIFAYLRLLVLPMNQNLDYDYPISTSFVSPPITLLAFIALLGIVGFAVAIFKKQPLYSFCVFFFLITLAPSSGIIPIVDVIFEHRLYFPCLGMFLLIALSIEKLYSFAERRNIAWRNAAAGVVCGLVIFGSIIATIHRNLVWRTPLALWEDVVAKSPNKARGHANLGHQLYILYSKALEDSQSSLLAENYLDKAHDEFKRALKLDSKQSDTYANLSLVYLALKRGDDAIAVMKRAVEYDSENPQRYLRLADAYYRLARYDEAVVFFDELFAEKPLMKERFRNYPELRRAMAKTYLALGMSYEVNNAGERYGAGFSAEKAVGAYNKSLEWEPLADIYYSLAVVLDRSGELDRALINYRKVLQLKPDLQYAEIVRKRIRDIEQLND